MNIFVYVVLLIAAVTAAPERPRRWLGSDLEYSPYSLSSYDLSHSLLSEPTLIHRPAIIHEPAVVSVKKIVEVPKVIALKKLVSIPEFVSLPRVNSLSYAPSFSSGWW